MLIAAGINSTAIETIVSPEESDERHGDLDKVAFPWDATLALDGDTLHIYYGAADTSIAMSIASIHARLQWLKSQS